MNPACVSCSLQINWSDNLRCRTQNQGMTQGRQQGESSFAYCRVTAVAARLRHWQRSDRGAACWIRYTCHAPALEILQNTSRIKELFDSFCAYATPSAFLEGEVSTSKCNFSSILLRAGAFSPRCRTSPDHGQCIFQLRSCLRRFCAGHPLQAS